MIDDVEVGTNGSQNNILRAGLFALEPRIPQESYIATGLEAKGLAHGRDVQAQTSAASKLLSGG